MEPWRTAWRLGIAPQLSTAGLLALEAALVQDDPRLIQGETLLVDDDSLLLDVSAACAIGYCLWKGDGWKHGFGLDEEFRRTIGKAEKSLASIVAFSSNFIRWFDETPRADMRRQLLPEVQRELARRATATPAEMLLSELPA